MLSNSLGHMCLSACWVSLGGALGRVQRTPKCHKQVDLKVTLSSVSELEFQKPLRSAYSSAAGTHPAAELQAIRKVGAASYICLFGGFSFSLDTVRRMGAETRQKAVSSGHVR